MGQFFAMGRGEKPTLVFLIAFAVVSFLPVWRTLEIGGMVVFGWLMAALMVVSPAVVLLMLSRQRRLSRRPSSGPGTGGTWSEVPGSEARGSETPGSEARGSETPGSEARGSEAAGPEVPGSETPGAGAEPAKQDPRPEG